MINSKWIKIITETENRDIIRETDSFIFLGAKAEFPNSQNENIERKGVDGELPGVTTFAPFNLVVRLGFDGDDEKDINLIELKLRKMFFKRKPYYIVTSDNPGIKYPVQNPSIEEDILDFSSTVYELTFPVHKGYAESVKDTSEFSLNDGNWQFEAGVQATNDVHYTHDHWAFRIFNGSNDIVNPVLDHNLKIKIHSEAPNGLKITNKTTGDVFEYKESLNYANELTINGVHPFLDNKQRVGKYTNFEWITLAPGYNQIVISGEAVSKIQTEWIFNFIYR